MLCVVVPETTRDVLISHLECSRETANKETSKDQQQQHIFISKTTTFLVKMADSGSIQKKIEELENEMARTQKNKATNYHLGTLKAKIAKLKSELINGPGGKSAGTKNAERGFDVTKSGDTRIGLVGFPSVGKSTLLTSLTGTRSEAAAYEFTTLTCIPGTMKYKGARIQVLDLPGIIEGAADGKGRGRQVISTARTCNLILIVLDSAKPVTHKKIIEQELFSFGIRINQQPAQIKFVKKEKGGIGYQEQVPQTKGMNADVARLVCKEYRISCAEIILREDVTVDQFIDVLEGNRAYIPVLYVFNKIDAITIEELDILDQMPVRMCVLYYMLYYTISLESCCFGLQCQKTSRLTNFSLLLAYESELRSDILPAQVES